MRRKKNNTKISTKKRNKITVFIEGLQYRVVQDSILSTKRFCKKRVCASVVCVPANVTPLGPRAENGSGD